MEKEQKLHPNQAIKQILDILEIFEIPETAIKKIKKLCWNLADFGGDNK